MLIMLAESRKRRLKLSRHPANAGQELYEKLEEDLDCADFAAYRGNYGGWICRRLGIQAPRQGR
jgi:hypothetical protein